MKKFLINAVLFLLWVTSITSVVIIVFEKKLGGITNSYNLKRHQLESQADSIQVLVLGTSQSLHGINPAYFNLKGYNASNTAQSFYFDEQIALRYLDKMPRLKYVLISISDYTFGYEIIDGNEEWRDYFYAQCWDIKFPEIKSSDLRLHSKILLYTPEISLGYALQGFHVNLTDNYTDKGWAKMIEHTDIDDINGLKRVQSHNSVYHSNRYGSIKSMLDTLLFELKKRNITPVLFVPPVTSNYNKYADKEKLKIMYNTISELCKKYKCKYYDYLTDSRFLVSDFGDCDHLNSTGAEKFSKILNEDILLNKKE
jgi:hypothetical protein